MYIDLSFLFNLFIIGINIAYLKRYGGFMYYTKFLDSAGNVLAEWFSFSPRDKEKTSRVADSLSRTDLVEYGVHRPDLDRPAPAQNVPWKGPKRAQK